MNKAKIVIAAFIWLIVLAIGVSIWKLWIEPSKQASNEQQRAEQERRVLEATEGNSRYRYDIALGVDSFSGYAILRSDEFKQQLASRGIRIRLVDDGADYAKRSDALAKGSLQIAAFPADALIKSAAASSTLPATIIAILDESRGADAIVAYKQKYPNINALNAPDTRFILVGDSPSETLVQVLMHDFDHSTLSKNPFERVASPEKIVERYKRSTPESPEVFVLWQPYVSQLLTNDQLGVVVDSSGLTGYIIDTLVVSRDFLLKNQEVVEQVLECYFRALYAYREPSKLEELLIADAKQNNLTISNAQSKLLSSGIQWKNTQENFAHFGLRGGSVVHIEDIVGKLINVLVASGAIRQDPTGGQPNRIFYGQPLAQLQTRNFHPGLQSETVREEIDLKPLSETQWNSLVSLGTLSSPELVFARGTAKLTEQSQTTLRELAEKLRSWPQYYLLIQGGASSQGDLEANKTLAANRAKAALEYLQSLGVPVQRMRANEGEVTGVARVTFVVSQLPY